MAEFDFKPLDQIPDISVDDKMYRQIGDALEEAMRAAARVSYRAANPLHETTETRLHGASAAALGGMNSLMAAAMAQCTIDPPPAAISGITNASGDIVLRCNHPTPHEWDRNGTRTK